MDRIGKAFPDSFVWKPADAFNLGVPDIHAVLQDGFFLAAEVKQVPRLFKHGEFMKNPEKEMLKHTFTGPQISMLRRLKVAGAQSYGIVRTHPDIAYRIDPSDIPMHGNFTPRLLDKVGHPFYGEDGWKFWTALEQ